MRQMLVATIVLALLLVPRVVLAAQQYDQGWDVPGNLAGWLPNTSLTEVEVIDSGGNPGGFLHTWGNVSGSFDVGAMSMIPEVTGDYAAAHVWRVSFDVLLVRGAFDAIWFRVRYQDSSHNGWMFPVTNTFPLGEWRHFAIPFNPNWSDAEAVAAGWIQEPFSPDFAATMSDVYTAEVRISGEGTLDAGIDNFRLDTMLPPVPVDIKPMSCPNPLNVSSQGVLPVALLGTPGFDPGMVVPESIRLEGVAPLRWVLRDVNTPPMPGECACSTMGPDGMMDLVLIFDTQDIAAALGPVTDQETRVLHLAGRLADERSFRGLDCVKMLVKGKARPLTEEDGGIQTVTWGRVKALYR